jgi:hypothetical protein
MGWTIRDTMCGRSKSVVFCLAPRPAVGPMQPPVQCVPGMKRPGPEADRSSSSSAVVMNEYMPSRRGWGQLHFISVCRLVTWWDSYRAPPLQTLFVLSSTRLNIRLHRDFVTLKLSDENVYIFHLRAASPSHAICCWNAGMTWGGLSWWHVFATSVAFTLISSDVLELSACRRKRSYLTHFRNET